jgi:nuclear protein localization family protein 4
MLIRFRGRDGQFRLDLDAATEFPTLTERIAEHIPKNVDLTTLRVGPKPQGDARNPSALQGVALNRVGIK